MSKVTIEVTQEQAKALEALLALLPQPEAPAKPESKAPTKAKTKPKVEDGRCIATRKGDGKACQGEALRGRKVCVAHSKVECVHGLTVGTCASCEEPKAQPKPKKKAAASKTKAKGNKSAKKALNGQLARAIRDCGGQPNGDTWKVAKDLLANGQTVEDAAFTAVTK